ncbi:MAG: hypothetical protein Q9187_001334 [Circinaria calcarea]
MKSVNSLLALFVLALASSSTAKPTIKASTPISCGSRGLPACPTGQSCINDPTRPGCDTAVDCPGICATLDGPTCGGIANLQCPDRRQVCVENPNDSCDPQNGGADCSGICVYPDGSSAAPPKYAPCGGLQGLRCPRGNQLCIDDPRTCDADGNNCCLMAADCLGICVGPKLTRCGTFSGPTCPNANQFCVDDPRDTCDLNAGGISCAGICV